MGKPIRNKQLMDFFLNRYRIFLSLLNGQMNYVHCRLSISCRTCKMYAILQTPTPSQALINLVKKCFGLQSRQNSLFLHSMLQSLGYFTLISCHSRLQLQNAYGSIIQAKVILRRYQAIREQTSSMVDEIILGDFEVGTVLPSPNTCSLGRGLSWPY